MVAAYLLLAAYLALAEVGSVVLPPPPPPKPALAQAVEPVAADAQRPSQVARAED